MRKLNALVTGVSKIARNTAFGLLCGLILAWAPISVQAIGLGKLKVHSALDEPLNAEIPFTAISRKERRKLKAVLATRAEFDAAGIDRPAHLADIKFSVAKRVDGSYFLQLTTDNAFRDPFLHILVRIEWAGGRLIREYSALIDPPYLVASKPSNVTAPITAPAPVPVITSSAPEPAADQWVPTSPSNADPVMVGEAKPETAPQAAPPPEIAPRVPEKATQEAAPAAEVTSVPEQSFEPLAAPEPMPEFPEYFGPSRVDSSRYQLDPVTGWPVDPEESEIAEAMTEAVEPVQTTQGKIKPATEEKFEPMAFPSQPADTGSYGALVPGSSYRVVRGDTMWEIAEQVKGSRSDMSVEQVVMAIYQANQGAFFDRNVNNLKAGRVINIPDESALERGNRKKAISNFRAHYDVWQEYRLKAASAQQTIDVAGAAETAKPAAKPRTAKKPAAKTKKAEAPKPAKPKATPADDLLRIVRSDLKREKTDSKARVPDTESRSGKKEKSALAERMASAEESLESSRMQTKETAERVGKVKEQLETQKRLIELENANLAKPQPAKPQPAQKPSAASKPAPASPAQKPVKKQLAKRPPPAPKPEQPGFFEEIINSFLGGGINTLIIIGVVAFLTVGLGGVYWRRRRAATLEFEESILNSTMDSDMEMTGDTGAEGDSGDTSFLSDFSQGGMGNIATDEVDPIAEAEVYLAYGRDEQAEEILREAIVREPSRFEVHEKLLEIYFNRGDVSAFETVAEELYASQGGAGGELWNRVAEMGKKINPDNPMFSGAPPLSGPPPGTDLDMGDGEDLFGGDDDLFGGPAEATSSTDMGSLDAGESMLDMGSTDDGGLEMDGELADTGLSMGAALDTSEEDSALDFNMDFSTDEGGADSAETVVADGGLEMGDSGLDFSLDDSGLDSGSSDADDGLSLDSGDDSGLDFALDESTVGDSGLDFGLEDSATEEGGLDFGLEESSTDDGGLDFGLEDSATEEGGLDFGLEESSTDDGGLDFGLEDSATEEGGLDFGFKEASSVDEEPSFDLEEAAADTGSELDFSVEAGDTGALSDFGEVADGMDMVTAEDTSVALAESEDSQQWDETATKLDLAKAYIDMGDADGARSILDEVMTEGNDSQKQQAEDLMAQIA